MPLDLAAVALNEANVGVDFMGQSCTVTYKPSGITQEVLEKTDEDDAFLAFFCTVITSWDVTEGRKKIPLTPEALKKVPLAFLRAVFQAVLRHGGQGDQGNSSSAG